jgi:hypothetical protein
MVKKWGQPLPDHVSNRVEREVQCIEKITNRSLAYWKYAMLLVPHWEQNKLVSSGDVKVIKKNLNQRLKLKIYIIYEIYNMYWNIIQKASLKRMRTRQMFLVTNPQVCLVLKKICFLILSQLRRKYLACLLSASIALKLSLYGKK